MGKGDQQWSPFFVACWAGALLAKLTISPAPDTQVQSGKWWRIGANKHYFLSDMTSRYLT
jgi:hypothetical protein